MTNGNFVLGTVMTMIFFSGVAGFFLVLAVFLQTGFGLSPLQSGLTTVPFPVGVLIASLVSGRLGSRWPRERIAAGARAAGRRHGGIAVVVGGVGDTVDHWRFALPLFLSGLGMGAAVAPLFQIVLSTVPPRDAGSGSGALQSFQQIGSALGIAVTGQIFFSSLKDGLASGTPAHPAFVSSMSAALHLRNGGVRAWSSSCCSFSGRRRNATKVDTARPARRRSPPRPEPAAPRCLAIAVVGRFGLHGARLRSEAAFPDSTA